MDFAKPKRLVKAIAQGKNVKSNLPVKGAANGKPLPVYAVAKPQALPIRVVYHLGGSLAAAQEVAPIRPGIAPPTEVVVEPSMIDRRAIKKVNGLTPRQDAMARWVAHGATIADAYRLAYRPTRTEPRVTSNHAARVSVHPKFRNAVMVYENAIENESRQQSVSTQDFVKGRLVIEAQDAPQAQARLKALELLGKTEGMFLNVTKTETKMDEFQLETLKTKLEQRLSDVLTRLGVGQVLDSEPAVSSRNAENPLEKTQAIPLEGGTPLKEDGSHPPPAHTMSLTGMVGMDLPSDPPSFVGSPFLDMVPSELSTDKGLIEADQGLTIEPSSTIEEEK